MVPAASLGETLLSPSLVRLFGREFAGLALAEGDDANRLARSYGFSFEGRYYPMSAPAIFVVSGAGAKVAAGEAGGRVEVLGTGTAERLAGGMMMWAFDKLDQVTRIDVSTGWLEKVLLDAELGAAEGAAEMTGRSDMVGRSDMIGRGRGRG